MQAIPISAKLLAALVVAIALFGSGCYLGYDYRGGFEAERVAEAQNETIERAREGATAAIIAMAKAARQDALDEASRRDARTRGIADANLKANSACNRDAESVGLLNVAIDHSNDSATAAGSVPEAVPAHTKASGWLGQISSRLGIRTD